MEKITEEELKEVMDARTLDSDCQLEFTIARAKLTRLITNLCIRYKLDNIEQLLNDGSINREKN